MSGKRLDTAGKSQGQGETGGHRDRRPLPTRSFDVAPSTRSQLGRQYFGSLRVRPTKPSVGILPPRGWFSHRNFRAQSQTNAGHAIFLHAHALLRYFIDE